MPTPIFNTIGAYCITMEDGQKIYDLIHPQLKAHEKVDLDFDSVEIVASPFLNAAIGQLLRDLSSDELNTYLKFSNLSPFVRPTLKHVIENAKTYYTNPAYQRAVDSVLQEEANVSNDD